MIVKDKYGLEMLSRLEKPSDKIKVVTNLMEMLEIYETMQEMKCDSALCSKLLTDFKISSDGLPLPEVMSVFGEVGELEELLRDFPDMD